jgi:hypothetical protein
MPCCTTALTYEKRPVSTSARAKACWSSRSEIELLIVMPILPLESMIGQH